MLRCNMTKPGSWKPVLNENDPKCLVLSNALNFDPRVNFICLDLPNFVEHTATFSSGMNTLEDEME